MYDLPALQASLAGTIFAGKLHFTSVTGSTNADALAAAREGASHGSVFLAGEQTAGRGRGNHSWISTAGDGLYVSILVRPEVPAARLPLLPLAAGLAAADAIHSVSGLSVDLRWPNDLLIGPRKCGGILVEALPPSKAPLHAMAVVIGVGINVHQRQFPADLATPATSLDLEAGKNISRQSLLVALLKSLEREASMLANEAAAKQIPARVEQASTWIRGRSVEVHGPQACTGVTAGLDEDGFLRVQTAGGLVTVQTGGLRETSSQ
ncbi:MAG TPA: biotin--[acetyl-CoA-carboxylase] ligase [Terracidiphilus sp.]|nr:biotin--[acetyl-CoA-carboxylase] ligase [Terracidiphilus sp.]